MRPFASLLVTAVLVHAVALAQPNTSHSYEPIPSVAQSAALGRGNREYGRRGMEALRSHMAELVKEHDVPQGKPKTFSLPDAGLTARCLSAEAQPPSEPVLLCQYGPTIAEAAARAIFWQEDGVWLGQLYPQPPDPIAAERRQLFRQYGCIADCEGSVRQARTGRRPDGLELLVVMELGTPAARKEEVHLLRLVDQAWVVAWVPSPGDWNWGHAQVTLMQSGLSTFGVRSSSWNRQDRFAGYLAEPSNGEHRWFTERWVRTGMGYILRDQLEEPGAYGALVRLVYYLSHHDDRRAQRLLAHDMGLDEARQALAQRPAPQGWKVLRVDSATFRLDRNGDGSPDLEVGFRHAATGWVLARLEQPPSPSSPDGEPQKEADGQREETGSYQ